MMRCPATLPRLTSCRTGRTGRTARTHRRARSPLAAVALATAAAGAVVLLGGAVRRVEVVGSSMEPALAEGDRLIVLRAPGRRQPWPAPGTVVAVRDPREPARVLVKRIASVDRSAGTIEVRGDAVDASTDSRAFGPLGRSALVGRAVYRYAPIGRSGPAPWPAEYDLP